MKVFLLLAVCLTSLALPSPGADKITIVLSDKAPPLEKIAAQSLKTELKLLFAIEVSVNDLAPADSSFSILLGSPQTNPAIEASEWPKLSDQGHILKSTQKGLIVGGATPVATLWAAGELSYHFGLRHLLRGDARPIEKPALKFTNINTLYEPTTRVRAWSGFSDHPHGQSSWPLEQQKLLFAQLVKLKFTHLVLPSAPPTFSPIPVDGDTAGRSAFKGARFFSSPVASGFSESIANAAVDSGLIVVSTPPPNTLQIPLGSPTASVLPEFSASRLEADFRTIKASHSQGFTAIAVMPGDLNAAAHFLSRAAYDASLTTKQAFEQLITPICGDGVSERLWLGFEHVASAAQLIGENDPSLGIPMDKMWLRHLASKSAPSEWITKVKNHYAEAVSEMYRGNTRSRDGARPFILYHAKRMEFALHYLTAIEALLTASYAASQNKADASAEATDAAVEGIYNALSAQADAARDPSDLAAIALLNQLAYRPLLKSIH